MTTSMWFDGDTYEPEFDQERLATQMGRVWLALREGEWLSLREIADRVDAPEASVSARIRDLRKQRFGSHEVARRHRGERGSGLFEYQLAPQIATPELPPADQQGTLL
jgi:biotin operon repressor